MAEVHVLVIVDFGLGIREQQSKIYNSKSPTALSSAETL